MEISTVSSFGPSGAGLPVPAQGRHLQTTVNSTQAVAPVTAVESAIQGEWLGREIPRAVPTEEYLRGSVYDMPHSRRHARAYGGVDINRLAINAYLGNTREGMRDASGRGRSVNYFV